MLRLSKIGLIFVFCFFLLFSPAKAVENPISYPVTVSATVGEPKLTVFGWTSPQTLVELRGQRVAEDVIANQQGYFLFDRVFLPRPTLHPRGGGAPAPPGRHLGGELGYPELCLTSIDRQSRVSAFPTCLPPLPTGPFEITVGPVLLPPTLSLSKGKFLPGEQIKASGATFPNSKVTVFLADEILTTPRTVAVRKAHARFLPQYEIKADSFGNFEFNLPANRPANWRVFASAEFLGSPSPKSNTLTFQVLSWWAWFWLKIKGGFVLLFAFLRPYWWLGIILGEILVILLLTTT